MGATTTKNEPFKHAPLDYDKPSLRLIYVSRAMSSEGLIQCTIRHTTVNASYTCLSYVWGDSTPLFKVLLNQKPFYIRRNLFDFLTVAQTSKELSKSLWIDALCIDQENNLERNHQVQQMGTIYWQSEKVICWLGNLEQVDDMFRIHLKKLSAVFTAQRAVRYNEFIAANELRSEWSLGYLKETVFDHVYWTRAWVTQEILLAPEAIIQVGTTELPLAGFSAASQIVFPMTFESSPMGRFGMLQKNNLLSWPLLHLIEMFKDRTCTNTHDHIYSLLSLCKERSELVVDYNLSSCDLMYQVLNCCPFSICLCSAAMVAGILGLAASDSPLSSDGDQLRSYPYLEFDVHSQDPDWPSASRNKSVDRLFTYAAMDMRYRREGDNSRGAWYNTYWTCTNSKLYLECSKEGKDTGAEAPVSPSTRKTENPWLVCAYGNGLEIFKKQGSVNFPVSDRLYTARLAFPLLAKAVKWDVPMRLCRRASDGFCIEILGWERPRIGYA